jgi:hypothetical protein
LRCPLCEKQEVLDYLPLTEKNVNRIRMASDEVCIQFYNIQSFKFDEIMNFSRVKWFMKSKCTI